MRGRYEHPSYLLYSTGTFNQFIFLLVFKIKCENSDKRKKKKFSFRMLDKSGPLLLRILRCNEEIKAYVVLGTKFCVFD